MEQPQEQQVADDSNVTPEEQAEYDMFVAMCYKLIYGKGSGDSIEQAITKADDVVTVLATLSAKTIISVEKSAIEAGKKLSDDVIFHGGSEVVAELVNYAVQLGKVKPEQEDDVLNKVVFQAIRIYGDQALQENLITADEKDAAMQAMKEQMAQETSVKANPKIQNAVSNAANQGALGRLV